MSAKRKRPQVRIFCDEVDKLLLLTEAQLKVWLYYRRRLGADGKAWGKKSTIAAACRFKNPETVKNTRSWLVKNGWLKPNGIADCGLPMFIATIGEGHSRMTEGASTDAGEHPEMLEEAFTDACESIHECGEGASTDDTEVPTIEVPTNEAPTDEELRPSDEVRKADSKCPASPDGFLLEPEERELLHAVQPVWDFEKLPELKQVLVQILDLGYANEVDVMDLLRHNRAHKKGALYIKTPQQYLDALLGVDGNFRLLNEYMTHEKCDLCTKHGVLGHEEYQKIKERREQMKTLREWVDSQQGMWDFALVPVDAGSEIMNRFVTIVNPKREKGAWAPEGFKLGSAIGKGDRESLLLSAAVRYVVNKGEHVSFEEFMALRNNAEEWGLASIKVSDYEKWHPERT